MQFYIDNLIFLLKRNYLRSESFKIFLGTKFAPLDKKAANYTVTSESDLETFA